MFEPLPQKFSFPDAERRVLAFWEQQQIFQKSLEQRAGAPRFVFYEGPPTANGMPHPGHCLTRAIKDIFPRYRTMTGHLVERKAGWDTHGLPVEREVEKELGLQGKADIEKYGVEKFIHKCISSVWRYTREWEEMTKRLGFWVNLEEAYATYHQSYVESVWWSLKTLFERGLLYQAHKVVWWWCQGGTALSAGEVGEGYRPVDDPSVFVKFPLVEKVPSTVGEVPPTGGTGILPVRVRAGTQADVTDAALPNGVDRDLHIRRRRLPHWEAGGNTYFITFRTTGVYKLPDGSVRSSELAEQERQIALNACLHFDAQRMNVHAAVVMPDHVHLLITPLEKAQGVWWPLAELLHSIKSFSAKQITGLRRSADPNWSGWVWQDEYFDRIIRTETDFEEKRDYILNNPVKRGLGEAYPWLWVETARGATNGGQDARPTRTSLLVWTTTPWTLISNHFAAVHPDLEYALVHDPVDNEHLYIAAALVETIAKKVKRELKVLSICNGKDLSGLRYRPPFLEVYYEHQKESWGYAPPTHVSLDRALSVSSSPDGTRAGDAVAALKNGSFAHIGWRTLEADFVTIESGTGIVHEAPAFGEVDFDLLQKERRKFGTPGDSGPTREFGEFHILPLLCAVNSDGTFNDEAPEKYRGRWIKDCDKDIIRELKERGLLYHQEQYRHDYPFCPRAENDPLIQYARKGWFVRTSQFKEEFLKNNEKINWLPDHIKEGRFGDFLRNNVDWALSRERFWGTPLPIWVCEKTGKMEAVGSFDELKGKPGATDGGFWEKKVAEHHAAGDPPLPEHLRVHKPYIDAWTYDSPFESGAKMRRVPEVIDCWWDAGSMPFAQWGFPHQPGSVEKVSERFPADFISEAIDQTRGWFYGLLAINTLLFAEHARIFPTVRGAYPLPYKTCIVLGFMLGEDGNKMSKRLRNYREPSYVFDAYGADAMRWYFFSAQAPWTTTRFTEANIRDSQREFLVKLYNVLSFFNIYANIDGFEPRPVPECGHRPTAQRGELDRWIISELHRTIRDVREAMDRFENFPAAKRLSEFVDALSNWYVRRSRDRFWRPVGSAVRTNTDDAAVETSQKMVREADPTASRVDQDKWDAYHTLYGCLWTLSQLLAPFTPFFAETMYQNLVNADFGATAGGAPSKIQNPKSRIPLSVHLCDYPLADESLIDESLSTEMDLVREIASLGRAARAASSVKEAKKVRQPLSRVEIILAKPEYHDWLKDHAPLIEEELNVKAVEFAAEADHYVSYKVVPNFPAIGKKYRTLVPGIKAALGALADPAAARKALTNDGALPLTIDGQTVQLTPEEVEIRLEAKPGWSAAQGRVGVVVVQTELTLALLDEGLMRELVHYVQSLRKEQELAYEARVVLFVKGPEKLLAVVRKFDETIRRECLAERVEFTEPPDGETQKVEIEGQETHLAVRRVF